MPKELILILGGARSGKSSYAQRLALERAGRDVLVVATAEAGDAEMRERIRVHQRERPAGWRTLEAPLDVGPQISTAAGAAQIVVLDCLTLLVSNVIVALGETASAQTADLAVTREIESLLAAYRAGAATWMIVSNEVGLGVVPAFSLGRTYRDALGRANQTLAAAADHVLFMVAGLPLRVKG